MSAVARNGYAVLPLETELHQGALEISPLFGDIATVRSHN
jgi:hypothetical protein